MVRSGVRPLVHKTSIILAGLICAVALLLSGFSTDHANAASNKKGQKYSDTILEIKFTDESDLEAQGNKFVGAGADEVNDILGKAKIQKHKQLFTRDKKGLKKEFRELKRQGKQVADLSQYHQVRIAADADISAVSEQLEALSVVEHAYPQPLPAQPPISPSWSNFQTYRHAAPSGVDTNGAATWPGATGNKVKVIDVEYSWNVNHEDLAKARAPGAMIPNGTYVDLLGNNDHGTAVLGILSADDNGFGVTGMVKNATLGMVNAYNTDGYAGANAIDLARANMTPGDVLLLEQQIEGPGPGTEDFVAIEWIPSMYDAIRTATAQEITVVEAAGNGGQNLNNATLFGSPFPEGKPDSGAIMVGAGGACSTSPRNSRLSFSTYGSRVNMQGNGECVYTTGFGYLYSIGGKNAYYTHAFNGTSSASAIVAGAAAAFSSAYEQLNGVAPTASFVRSSLQATGTSQNVAAGTLSGNIGPLPNLANALPRTDLTAPTAPVLQSVTSSIWYRKPVLKWAAATDNVAMTGYKIYRNNALIATVSPTTSYTDNSAARGATYTYQVSALDKAGRESPKSNGITIVAP